MNSRWVIFFAAIGLSPGPSIAAPVPPKAFPDGYWKTEAVYVEPPVYCRITLKSEDPAALAGRIQEALGKQGAKPNPTQETAGRDPLLGDVRAFLITAEVKVKDSAEPAAKSLTTLATLNSFSCSVARSDRKILPPLTIEKIKILEKELHENQRVLATMPLTRYLLRQQLEELNKIKETAENGAPSRIEVTILDAR